MNLTIRWLGLCSLVLAGALFSGCASHPAKDAKNMAGPANAPTSPPPGKTLVCIHRPSEPIGYKMYSTSIWDGTNYLATLWNNHSIAYVCEPGTHYFMNLSVEITGCVEAQLLPDQIYDLWVDHYMGWWVHDFKIKPMHQDDRTRQRVAKWSTRHEWVQPAPQGTGYEQKDLEKMQRLLEEFSSGKRADRLQHLAADDHR